MFPEFDIFISYKQLDSNNVPTRDCSLAKDVFTCLKSRGWRVFLSDVTLESMGIAAYKRAIDQALDSAMVLIVVGTCPDHLDSQWVRYEWESFHNDILSGRKPLGRLFSYLATAASDLLPRTIRENTIITHGPGSIEKLEHYVENALGRTPRNAPRLNDRSSPARVGDSELKHDLLDLPASWNDFVLSARRHVAASWERIEAKHAGRDEIADLLRDRVKFADTLVAETLDFAIHSTGQSAEGCAIVARGGYGTGYLSHGSDLDLTFLHAPEAAERAVRLYQTVVGTLVDIWGATRALRVAPIINSMDECRQKWIECCDEVSDAKLEGLVSYTQVRPLAGNSALFDELRRAWSDHIRTMKATQFTALSNVLASRIAMPLSDPLVSTFDLKRSGGGLLDLSLTRFVDALSTARGIQTEGEPADGLELRDFLLRIREAAFSTAGAHLLGKRNFATVAQAVYRQEADSEASTRLSYELSRCRQRIRARLVERNEVLGKLQL